MTGPATCAHCSLACRLTTGREVYPHRKDLSDLRFWVCESCEARVGCHKEGAVVDGETSDGTMPLGRAANAALRRARSEVHKKLDPIWRTQPKKERRVARRRVYRVISRYMGLPMHQTHVGMFNLEQCRQAWRALDAVNPHNVMDLGRYVEEIDAKREAPRDVVS